VILISEMSHTAREKASIHEGLFSLPLSLETNQVQYAVDLNYKLHQTIAAIS